MSKGNSFFDSDEYSEFSDKRIKKIISTKCNTIFIGALSDIEAFLGHLWGHDPDVKGAVDPESLTDEQYQYYELWQELRTSILDRGHFQLDNILKELTLHKVHRKINSYHFKPKKHPDY